MTLAELYEASLGAGNALRAYKDNWTAWRESLMGEIRGSRAALNRESVRLGIEAKRVDKIRTLVKGLEQEITIAATSAHINDIASRPDVL